MQGEEPQAPSKAELVDRLLKEEVRYVRQLRLLVKSFYDPLCRDGDLLSSQELEALFSGTHAVADFHTELLQALVQAHQSRASGEVGTALRSFAKAIPAYAKYVDGYSKSVTLHESLCKVRSGYVALLKAQGEPPMSGSTGFTVLRSAPMARIPRLYQCMQQLKRATDAKDDDHVGIAVALKALKAIERHAHQVEEERRVQRASEMTGLASRFKGGNLGALNESMADVSLKFGTTPTSGHHAFKVSMYKKPTWCKYCFELIGLRGPRCRKCGFTAHKKCQLFVVPNCGRQTRKGSPTIFSEDRFLRSEAFLQHETLDGGIKECKFFLFNDSVCIARVKGRSEEHLELIDMIKWTSKSSGRTTDIEPVPNVPTSFTVTNPRNGQVHILIATDANEASMWLKDIRTSRDEWLAAQADRQKQQQALADHLGAIEVHVPYIANCGDEARFVIEMEIPGQDECSTVLRPVAQVSSLFRQVKRLAEDDVPPLPSLTNVDQSTCVVLEATLNKCLKVKSLRVALLHFLDLS